VLGCGHGWISRSRYHTNTEAVAGRLNGSIFEACYVESRVEDAGSGRSIGPVVTITLAALAVPLSSGPCGIVVGAFLILVLVASFIVVVAFLVFVTSLVVVAFLTSTPAASLAAALPVSSLGSLRTLGSLRASLAVTVVVVVATLYIQCKHK